MIEEDGVYEPSGSGTGIGDDGGECAGGARGRPRRSVPGDAPPIVGVLADRRAAAKAADSGQVVQALGIAFERAPIGMALLDAGGRYLRANAALCGLLGRPPEDVVGRPDRTFTHPEDREADERAAARSLDGELDAWQAEKRFVRPEGGVAFVIASMTAVRDEAGGATAWLGQYQDVSEHKALEQRLRRLADEDSLTSVPNRRSFEASVQLALELSARHHIAGSLLMIDLDGFKAINDTHGHAIGDAALAAVAGGLRERLRSTDLLARVGGDEFAVLLRSTGRRGAEEVADALTERVLQTRLAPGMPEIVLSASVGVTEFGAEPLPTLAELFAAADAAMYAAKRRSSEN